MTSLQQAFDIFIKAADHLERELKKIKDKNTLTNKTNNLRHTDRQTNNRVNIDLRKLSKYNEIFVQISNESIESSSKKIDFPKDKYCIGCRRIRTWYLFQRYRNICIDCVELLNC